MPLDRFIHDQRMGNAPMSYCRFGPDSDVYVYADVGGGWTTHLVCNGRGFVTHNDSTLEELRDRLIALREKGLTIPDYTFRMIDEEISEE